MIHVLTHKGMLEHGGCDQEVPDRLRAAWAGISDAADRGVTMIRHQARPARRGELERVHPSDYVNAFADCAAKAEPIFMHRDCPITPGTWSSALLAAGAACEAAGLVLSRSNGHRAFCAIRPPGHHAQGARAAGFCYFNNAVLAARALSPTVGRVLILDMDFHHGDGSQDLVDADAMLAYGSVHADPTRHYPGTGTWRRDERCVSWPLPDGAGAERWHQVWLQVLDGLEPFKPGGIVISFGADALRGDPIGDMGLTASSLAEATRAVVRRWPSVPLVSVLEGGYDLAGLQLAVSTHLEALAELAP